ncbi:hypothetical protein ACROYT_G021106 [Oculina patagonica]
MAAAPGDSSPSKKLKLVVFGATGRTGNEVVKQALEKGHHVTAVVRTPEKLTTQHENLVLVKGDACDVESFAAALDGKDAVLSSLGVYANIFNPTTFYSESMNAITEAMSRHKITRLVTVTSWCTQPGPNNYWFLEWVIKPLFLNGVIKDMATMEKMLESSDPQALNYTIVRPCRLLVANGELPTQVKDLEEIVCQVYCKAGPTTLAELRWELFRSRNLEAEMLPPMPASLLPYIIRANFKAMRDISLTTSCPDLPSLKENCFSEHQGAYVPVMCLSLPAL